jgi:hypothetical protein
MFGQVLQIFSKKEFYSAVKETKAEKGAKGFSCWDQFVAMLFCHLGQARSLREICGGLATCLGKVKHLGIQNAPSRSTLSYVNKHRPWQLYEKVFYQLLSRCKPLAKGKKKFRFKSKLYSLDASLIDLCLSLFDWATYRKTKGAVKLHLLLDHEGYLPVFANITEGSVHEINIARKLTFAPVSIIAVDRGYTDYGMFSRWINVPVMHHGRPARNDGLGRIFIGHVGPGTLGLSTAIVVLLILPTAALNPVGSSPMNVAGLCVSFCAGLYILGLLAVKFFTKRFGGLTGDHFGALTEASEVLFLLAAYIWLRHFSC